MYQLEYKKVCSAEKRMKEIFKKRKERKNSKMKLKKKKKKEKNLATLPRFFDVSHLIRKGILYRQD